MPFADKNQKKDYNREYMRQRRTEAARKNTPFCYVTKSGKTVGASTLENYALKEDSQQIGDRFTGLYTRQKLVAPLFNPETLAQAIEINTYHARCCQEKARATAGLGWDLHPMVEQPDMDQKAELNQFFNKQSRPLTVIFSRHQYDIEVIGYGAIEVVREEYRADGKPVLLEHIPAKTLRMHASGTKVAQQRGSKARWFKVYGYEADIDKNTGQESPLGTLKDEDRASEVLWNTLYSQRSEFYGMPDVIPALGALHADLARRDYNIAFFGNYGVPAYAVFITGDYDPGPVGEDGKTELEAVIEEHFKELKDNPHSTMVLSVPTKQGGGNVEVRFQALAVETREASFRLFRKDNRDEILAAHGVPGYRIGVSETGSLGGSTARESTNIYKHSIVKPRQEILEALITQDLIQGEQGFNCTDWEFKFREIDTTDEKHDIDMVKALFNMGALRIRDVIQLYAERYGIEDEPGNPLLDQRFINGQPVKPEEADAAGAVLRSLQAKLLEVAHKHERDTSNRDGLRDGTDFVAHPGGEKLAGVDGNSG